VGSTEQTKAGNLIIGGVLRLGQFATAPSGTEGALYFDTTESTTKLYSNSAWTDLGGGWDGVIPNYTTAQRNALSLADGLIVYNTTDKTVQIYTSGAWTNIGGKLSSGVVCSLDGDCDSAHCVDGVCCDTVCSGTCEDCNVAGSLGTCTDVASDCTGNCDVCTSGNCAANASLCTGNCDTCSGSGTAYNCAASVSLCTGNCDVCSGSGTAYNCAASNALCSNTTSSCNCSGSGTVFNCQSCPDDPYGVCGHPTCSSYTCGTAYDNGVACSTCHTCSSGFCTAHVSAGSTGLNCTATHYRCDGAGGCTAPTSTICETAYTATMSGTSACAAAGYDGCEFVYGNLSCSGVAYFCSAGGCACSTICWNYVYD